MEREQLDRLLAEYATGGLSEADKEALFTAALADQELFDQLMEEDELRETIEMPGARNRLIDALQEEPVAAEMAVAGRMASVIEMPARARAAAPVSKRPGRTMWLAWAAGIGVVFLSGAISFMVFERMPVAKMVVGVNSSPPRETKPFVPPPSPAPVSPAKKVIVEEPPVIAEGRAVMNRPPNIALPSAPPPPPPEPMRAKEIKVSAEQPVLSARSERDLSRSQSGSRVGERQQAPVQIQQAPGAAPAAARQQAMTDAMGAGAEASSVKKAMRNGDFSKLIGGPIVSVWRRTGDGVWVRVPPGESAGRGDVLAVRYVPTSNATVAIADASGRPLVSKPGRVGEELELIVPAAAMQRADGGSLSLVLTEGARATPVKILLRQE